MRTLIVLSLMTTPALAHPGAGPHLHSAQGLWIVAAALVLGTGLTCAVLRKPARVRA